MHWTPEDVTALATQIAGIIGGVAVIIRLLQNNKSAADNSHNSVPADIVHKLMEQVTPAAPSVTIEAAGTPNPTPKNT